MGLDSPFCDGIGVPKTRLTDTERNVRTLFQKYDLKLHTVVSKEKCWFVKLDEDAMPDFLTLKKILKNLSNFGHEQLAGQSEFFLQ